MERNIYLNMKSLPEARRIMFDAFAGEPYAHSETIPVLSAVGRVLSEAVYARCSSPNFNAAAMDGIAVRAADTFGASESAPRQLGIGRQAHFVNTGQVMPEGTDAVIMIENVNTLDETTVEIEAAAFPWQNVRRVGEDIVATELLFPSHHQVTPYCLGALITGGVFAVRVKRPPRVLIIPTGNEVVDWRSSGVSEPGPGEVLESNAYLLGSLVEAWGGDSVRQAIVADDQAAIGNAVEAGVKADYDIVMTIGGSSAGAKDLTKKVIADIGEVLVHGVTIMPGKPLLIGKVKQKPVFGVPGYQVSAIIAFEQFVGPLIRRYLGLAPLERQHIMAEPSRKIPSKLGVEEFLRVKLGKVGERVVATPLARGAGSITTITEADGVLRISAHLEGVNQSETVAVELLRPVSALEKSIVAVGSHDNTLDVLTDMLRAEAGGLSLSSSHVGSMGGLMAVGRGVCHMAGCHLFDPENGTYNQSYIERYIPQVPLRRINLVRRDQGLIVARGNPLGIRGIEDLGREGVRFINRQGGSGTRILLDYRIAEVELAPEAIDGYDAEEFTHMAVAVAVLSGSADVGLGINAAARALGLDFIPVVTEQYDLIIPEAYFEWPPMQRLLNIICGDVFKARVTKLGGYHTDLTGQEL
jgi:putative molybdopterin biosynthesis protein